MDVLTKRMCRLCPAQGCPAEGCMGAETPQLAVGAELQKDKRATYSHSHKDDSGPAGS